MPLTENRNPGSSQNSASPCAGRLGASHSPSLSLFSLPLGLEGKPTVPAQGHQWYPQHPYRDSGLQMEKWGSG